MLTEKMARQLAFAIAPDLDLEEVAHTLLLAVRRLEAAGIRVRVERVKPSGAALADGGDGICRH